jgi:hypothetical protein
MKKRVFLILIIALMVLMSLACVGSEEISRAATTGQDSAAAAATATSAAQEFHVQLTLTAAEAAAAQGSVRSP